MEYKGSKLERPQQMLKEVNKSIRYNYELIMCIVILEDDNWVQQIIEIYTKDI